VLAILIESDALKMLNIRMTKNAKTTYTCMNEYAKSNKVFGPHLTQTLKVETKI